MRWRSCVNPAMPMPCVRDTATTTRPLPPGLTPSVAGHERRLNQAELEIDNLRAAFAFSRENGDTGHALLLASCLQPLWRARGRLQEGLAWFAAALADHDAHPAGPTLGCMRGHWPTGP